MDISEVERLAKVSNFAQLAEEKASIVIPASSYQVDNDSRILVPFIKNHKFGFLNRVC